MNNVLVAFCASAFVLSSASAPAQGMSGDNDLNPPSKIETQDAKTAEAAAKARWASMTPEQQAAARKAAREKWDKIAPERNNLIVPPVLIRKTPTNPNGEVQPVRPPG